MSGKTLRSSLVLSLIDKVSKPSRKIAHSLAGIKEATGKLEGTTFANRLSGAIRDNDHALNRARGGLVDAVAGFYTLRTAIGAPLNAAISFESAMSKVGAVARADDTELAALTQTARKLGAETNWSASQVAEGMQFLSMAGFKVNETIAAMPGMLSLASAGAIDLSRASDIASNILTGFGMKAEEMGYLGDVLTNTFTSSNTDLSMLGETMKYVAPNAHALGVSLEQTAAMAGKLGDAGIQGSQAGTALRAMFLRLSSLPKPAAEALAELGVETMDAQGNLRDMPTVFAELDSAMKKFGSGDRAGWIASIFGMEAASAAEILMDQAGRGELQTYVETLKETGSAARIAAKMNDTARGSIKRLLSAAESLAISVGNALLPSLTSIIETMIPMVNWFDKFAEAHPTLITAVVAATGSLIAFKSALAALKFLGLLGRGGALNLLSIGMKTVGRAGIHMHSSATAALALQDALAGATSQKRLSGLSRLRFATAAVARSAVPIGRMTRAVHGLKAAFMFLGGPMGVVIAAAGALAYAMGTFKSPSEQFQQLSNDLDETLGKIEEVNATLGADYDALEQANKKLAAAIASGGDAAVAAAQKDVDAIKSRIKASEQYRAELAVLAKSQLIDAEQNLQKLENSANKKMRDRMLQEMVSKGGTKGIASEMLEAQIRASGLSFDEFFKEKREQLRTDMLEAGQPIEDWQRDVTEARMELERFKDKVAEVTKDIQPNSQTGAPTTSPRPVARPVSREPVEADSKIKQEKGAPTISLRPVSRSDGQNTVKKEVNVEKKTETSSWFHWFTGGEEEKTPSSDGIANDTSSPSEQGSFVVQDSVETGLDGEQERGAPTTRKRSVSRSDTQKPVDEEQNKELIEAETKLQKAEQDANIHMNQKMVQEKQSQGKHYIDAVREVREELDASGLSFDEFFREKREQLRADMLKAGQPIEDWQQDVTEARIERERFKENVVEVTKEIESDTEAGAPTISKRPVARPISKDPVETVSNVEQEKGAPTTNLRPVVRPDAKQDKVTPITSPRPDIAETGEAPDSKPRPVTRSAIPPDIRNAEEVLAAARLAENLPTPQALQELKNYAGELRTEIAEFQAEIDALVEGPMKDVIVQGKQPELDILKQDLADIEQEIVTGNTRADELRAALSLLSETNVTPEINTTSIDQALAKIRAMKAGLQSFPRVNTGATPAVIPIDGQREAGGPVAAGGTYLVGEKGPELLQTKQSGFVHNARNTARLLKGMVTQSAPKRSAASFPAMDRMLASARSTVAVTAGIPVPVSTPANSAPTVQITGPLFGSLTVHHAQDPMAMVDQIGEALEQKLAAIMRGIHSDYGGT